MNTDTPKAGDTIRSMADKCGIDLDKEPCTTCGGSGYLSINAFTGPCPDCCEEQPDQPQEWLSVEDARSLTVNQMFKEKRLGIGVFKKRMLEIESELGTANACLKMRAMEVKTLNDQLTDLKAQHRQLLEEVDDKLETAIEYIDESISRKLTSHLDTELDEIYHAEIQKLRTRIKTSLEATK